MLYLLIDGARIEGELIHAKKLNPDNSSLYEGKSMRHLASVSPHLFKLSKNTQFSDWFLKTGWGKSWGIVLSSPASFDNLLKHFRKFLIVRDEYGKELYFRFYDPRVLCSILPGYDKNKLLDFLRPVDLIYCEDAKSDNVLLFSQSDGRLNTQQISKNKFFNGFGVKITTEEVKTPLKHKERENTIPLSTTETDKTLIQENSGRWGWMKKM